jgi:threonine dehydrogenase-like Zn-dependent dehydrogenase
MRATVLHAARSVSVDEVPDARIQEPTDVVVKVELAAVCGSELGGYQGIERFEPGQRMGHEFLGTVVETGRDVHTFRRGDRVIAPLSWSCGTCLHCDRGLCTSCLRGGSWGMKGTDGGQGEAVRVPFADATLVRLPELEGSALASALTASDVLAAGWHAVYSSRVGFGSNVAIVGDGSQALCAVQCARVLGAERIILLGRYPHRVGLALEYGATDVITSRDQLAIDEVREVTGGLGADVVVDSFGSEQSISTAVGAARDGGEVVLIGIMQEPTYLDVSRMIMRNVTFRAGIVPARQYLEPLLNKVADGVLDTSALFDQVLTLDETPAGYAAMSDRTNIKSLIRI